MKERPILFSAPMVRALLAGTKTQTRRAWREQPPAGVQVAYVPGETRSPYGQPGDRLWVREAHAIFIPCGLPHRYYRTGVLKQEPISEHATASREVVYRADGQDVTKPHPNNATSRWRPSIHMPRWASRILLEIVSVRVERLQAISEADAQAEGVEQNTTPGLTLIKPEWRAYGHEGTQYCTTAAASFRTLWESINGAQSWEADPWVWVVEFKRVTADSQLSAA